MWQDFPLTPASPSPPQRALSPPLPSGVDHFRVVTFRKSHMACHHSVDGQMSQLVPGWNRRDSAGDGPSITQADFLTR